MPPGLGGIPLAVEEGEFASGTGLNFTDTCYGAEGGSVVDATLRDPSTSQFCYFTTGAPSGTLAAPPPVTCELLGRIDSSFSMANCQADFCQSGTDGYMTFLEMMINLLKTCTCTWPVHMPHVHALSRSVLVLFYMRISMRGSASPCAAETPRFRSPLDPASTPHLCMHRRATAGRHLRKCRHHTMDRRMQHEDHS